MLTTSHPINPRFEKLLKFTGLGLMIIYLINCCTPLRLHVDTLRYFAIKDCFEFGCPADSVAAKDYLPYGYTFLLLALSKLGILKSGVIVLVNCIYLFAALQLIRKWLGAAIYPFLFISLVLLNWTMIKFALHPLSEMQYVFFSVASLYFFHKYSTGKSLMSLLWAFVFGAMAFLTRSVGLALAAALVTGLLWQFRKKIISLVRENKILAAIVLIIFVGIALFSKQLGLNHYTGVMTKQFNEGKTFGGILKWHFTEWAEVFFNTSSVKVIPHLPMGNLLFVLAGIGFLLGFVYLLFIRKNNIHFIIKAYLFFYIIMMLNWPFYDPRFWVPIIPLIAATISQVSFYKNNRYKWLLAFLFGIYMAIGVTSVGYMTYTSLNKEVMAKTQANGVYRNEYETIFYGKPQSDTAKKVDPVIVHVLERYNSY